STKTYSSITNVGDIAPPVGVRRWVSGAADDSAARQAHRSGDGIVGQRGDGAVTDHVFEEGEDVAPVHLARVEWQRAREVDRAEHRDAAGVHGLLRPRDLTVAAG